MPVRICFITNYAYRLFNRKSHLAFGGIETIFYIIAKDLSDDKRFEVNFLLEDDVHKNPVTEKINGITLYKTSRKIQPAVYQDKQIEKYHRWFTYWARKFSWLWQWPHLEFFRLWENLRQINADIYIFASPGYESGLITFLARIMKKKSVYLVVNDEELYRPINNFKDKIFYFGLKHANIVWCLSVRHQTILKNRHNLKAINLPCWLFRPKKILPLEKRHYILWAGRIDPHKHPAAFIKLARRLPRLKFLMIVAASPNEPVLFKSIVKSGTKIPNLKLKQEVMFTDVGRYYERALALIDTSDYKNLNMTVLQAAYYKVPCLSLFEDPENSFNEYQWGLSANGDIKKMIDNINKVIGSPREWKKLATNGYLFANKIYNPEANLTKFKNLMLLLSK